MLQKWSLLGHVLTWSKGGGWKEQAPSSLFRGRLLTSKRPLLSTTGSGVRFQPEFWRNIHNESIYFLGLVKSLLEVSMEILLSYLIESRKIGPPLLIGHWNLLCTIFHKYYQGLSEPLTIPLLLTPRELLCLILLYLWPWDQQGFKLHISQTQPRDTVTGAGSLTLFWFCPPCQLHLLSCPGNVLKIPDPPYLSFQFSPRIGYYILLKSLLVLVLDIL